MQGLCVCGSVLLLQVAALPIPKSNAYVLCTVQNLTNYPLANCEVQQPIQEYSLIFILSKIFLSHEKYVKIAQEC